jgi:hypothetical protein
VRIEGEKRNYTKDCLRENLPPPSTVWLVRIDDGKQYVVRREVVGRLGSNQRQ